MSVFDHARDGLVDRIGVGKVWDDALRCSVRTAEEVGDSASEAVVAGQSRVEVYGPLPPSGRPRLLVEEYGSTPSETGAFCFQMKDRVAKFILPAGAGGDRILNLLDRYPVAKARPVSSYGLDGWVLRV